MLVWKGRSVSRNEHSPSLVSTCQKIGVSWIERQLRRESLVCPKPVECEANMPASEPLSPIHVRKSLGCVLILGYALFMSYGSIHDETSAASDPTLARTHPRAKPRGTQKKTKREARPATRKHKQRKWQLPQQGCHHTHHHRRHHGAAPFCRWTMRGDRLLLLNPLVLSAVRRLLATVATTWSSSSTTASF